MICNMLYQRAATIEEVAACTNSVLTCQQTIINSTASAPPNATKIAVKKVSDVNVSMFGPEL